MHGTAFAALAAAAVAIGALSVPAADAATLEELVNANPQWTFEGHGAEDLGVDQNGNGRHDEGDTLRSIFSFQQLVNTSSGESFRLDGTTHSALHGLSEIEVAKKTEVSPGIYNVDFQPHAGFEEDFGAGAMAVLWESNTPLNPFMCGTKTTCEARATAGDIRLVLGFEEGKQNVWGAGPNLDDIQGARHVPVGTKIGEYEFRINVLEDDLDVPLFVAQRGMSRIAGTMFSGPAEAIGRGRILGSGGSSSEYPIFNDTHIQMAVVPVPGAFPLLLAGLGALGMIGWRRNAD